MRSVQVLVVGAGPVGLTLAIDLGRRGVDCLLVDQLLDPLGLPKMERCNARTMEIYRRMGLADTIRAASYPSDVAMDVCVMGTMAEEPWVRLSYPSVDEAKATIAACGDGSEPLEPYQVVSQYTLEPMLRSVAEGEPCVTTGFGWELTELRQDGGGVTAKVQTPAGPETVQASYLVGCDGGRSTVRKQIGIALSGDGSIARRNQVFLRSEDFFDLCPSEPGRMYFFANADESIVTVQDDRRHFSFHTSCFGDEDDLRRVIDTTLGLPVTYEIIAATPWTLHLLVADRLTVGRVHLAGDAAHLMIPAGGLGLNTGIGDAIDLSWKLAATLAGWGGPQLLASYEIERGAVARRNREASRYAAQGQVDWRAAVRPDIDEDTPEGRGTRLAVIRLASVEQRKTHEMVGTELGYRYETSPIVCQEQGFWPPDVREVYVPTARPGARLPHHWLSDGRPLQDVLGPDFNLLQLDGGHVGTELAGAITDRGAAVAVVQLDEPVLAEALRGTSILVRPDLHVSWRGSADPDDPLGIADRVTGWSAPDLP